jgi:hypothetical protein
MQSRQKKRFYIRYLPIFGCVSTGIIYVGIGVIAILSFLKIKNGGADESSMLAFLENFLIGKFIIWIILLGSFCYIAWRIYESVKDPYGYGKEAKGIATRTGIALSTVADAFIAYSAIQVLLGGGNIQEDGQPEEQREMASLLLQANYGDILIISIGGVIFVTAIVQFMYGITRGYSERLDIAYFSSGLKSLIHFLAWAGYFARGIVLGIVGFYFIKAGILEEAQYIVNTDKAFDFIGDHIGHLYFIIVAVGTICYGLFMFVLGITYDTDED